MPILPSPKWENVAQALARGEKIKDAFSKQYPARNYNKSRASTFCSHPDIKNRVREIQQDRIKVEHEASEDAAKALGINKKWVLERLRFNAERALRGQPVFDKDGVQIPGKFTGRPDGATANASLKLIGLELGMFIERHEIGGPGDFSRLTDAELAARALEDAAALGLPPEATEALLLTFQPHVDEPAE